MFRIVTSFLLGCFLLESTAPTQVGAGETGLLLSKASGTAGVVCSGEFSCNFLDTTLARGEGIELTVRGVFGRPFAVFLGAAQPPICFGLTGVHNAALFIPFVVPFAGILDAWDSILACPGGRKQFRFSVPASLPVGSQVLFQGAAWSYLIPAGEVPTFTVAIRGTIR
jgi:hypothetical protein